MNRRLAIFDLAYRHGLEPEGVRDLQALQAQASDPQAEARALARGAAIAAAALIGLGIILWIAANWPALGRAAKFALLQSAVAAMAAGAMWRPAARVPLLLLAFLAQGAVLAFFGQTYQTGADPWQLFALWAVLALPWCMAARSQALWAPWTLVGMVAASLWIHAHQGRRWVPDESFTTVHLAGWLAAFALTALSCPWPALRRLLGTGAWSFRTGVVLTAAMLASSGLIALFGRHVAPTYGLALLLLATAALVLALLRVRDVFALSAMGLSIDTLLVGGLVRWLFQNVRGDAIGQLFLLAIAAALLVAGTVVIVTRLARGSATPATPRRTGLAQGVEDDAQAPSRRWLATAVAQGLLPAEAAQEPPSSASRPWPVVLLGFMGAQLAAWPLIAFVGALFGQALLEGPSSYLVGSLLVAGACIVLRGRVAAQFIEHLALTVLLAGLGVLCFRLMRDLGNTGGGLVSAALMIGIAFALPLAWVRAILGASAACTVYLAFTRPGWLGVGLHPFWLAGLATALAWVAGLVAQSRVAVDAGRWRSAAAFESTLGGWLMATLALLAMSSGMSLLVGGMLDTGASAALDFSSGRPHGPAPSGWTAWLSGPAAFSVGCLIAAWAWCATRSDAHKALLRGPLALALLLVSVLLAVFTPAVGLAAALGLLASSTGRPWQASAACLTAAWIVGAFYYQLAWPLETKALVLLAAGVVLGAVTWLLHQPASKREPSRAPAVRGGVAWTATGLLATLATLNIGIWQKEDVIARGRPVYIELAPVDPRSLMQGDFMALNYRMDEELRHQLDQAGTLHRPLVTASMDERGVARLDRLASSEVPAGRLLLELTPKNGRWVVASDAWFFREGDGRRFQQARYGEFRVDREGRALLVGLADAQLRRIEP